MFLSVEMVVFETLPKMFDISKVFSEIVTFFDVYLSKIIGDASALTTCMSKNKANRKLFVEKIFRTFCLDGKIRITQQLELRKTFRFNKLNQKAPLGFS